MQGKFIKIILALTFILTPMAKAEKIGDLTTLLGGQGLRIEGEGIVTGLNGTGDEKAAARKMIQRSLENKSYSLSSTDLDNKGIAFVRIDTEIPSATRPSEKITVRVSSLFGATLKGGILKETILRGTNGQAILRVNGRITINDKNPTTGYITDGGIVIDNELLNPDIVAEDDTFQLLLKRKSFADAAAIARAINGKETTNPFLEDSHGFEDQKPAKLVARALDKGSVQVQIPPSRLKSKVEYISTVLNLDVAVSQPATILLDRQSGVAIITGDVRVSPGHISFNGLTVTLGEQVAGQQQNYDLKADTPRPVVDMLGHKQSGSSSLQQFVNTLSAMKMTTDDTIVILEKLKKVGSLHAKIISE